MKMEIKKCEKVEGKIQISGSKNTALPVMCAALLTRKKVIIDNVPDIEDIKNLIEIIQKIGCNIKIKKEKVIIKANKFNPIILVKNVELLRGSYYLMGASLTRYGKCITYLPGGCNFDNRPIDFHLNAFKQLGYEITIYDKIIKLEKKNNNKKVIELPKKSVGATINTILASLNFDEVTIKNISLEPEVLEVINFLKILGGNIELNNDTLIIRKSIFNKKAYFKIIGDRIETGSYMLLASAIPNSKLIIKEAPIKYLENVIDTIKKIGTNIYVNDEELVVISNNKIKHLNLTIEEYPSFPTDLQQILTCVLLKANDPSTIKDLIYPKRISHIEELNKIGANIVYDNNTIIINHANLSKGEVIVKDLRCGFALIVAACICDDFLVIENFEVLKRGYQNIMKKLTNIGVNIKEYDL